MASPEATTELAGLMNTSGVVGTSFPSGLLGGPWHWNTSNAPAAVAAPATVLVHLAWVVLALTVSWVALRRRRSLRAWGLLASYLAVAYVLLLISRTAAAGGYGGLEYRYVTDVAAVAVLCLGLATMPLLGAVESSELRDPPVLLLAPHPLVVVVATTVVCVSGLASSMRYAQVWHDDNPGADYLQTVRAGLAGQGPLDLADQVVPKEVVPALSAPLNQTSRLLPLLVTNASFPSSTPSLVVLDEDGTPTQARIEPVRSGLRGPVPGCGWRIDGGTMTTIPLDGPVIDYDWWIQIDYLSSADDVMTITGGAQQIEVELTRGLGTVFVHIDDEFDGFDKISIGGLQPGTTLCVDAVAIGSAEPGGAL